MGWKDITEDQRNTLLDDKLSGIPVEELAAHTNMRPTTLDRRLREWARKTGRQSKRLRGAELSLARWDSPPVFSGNATVTGDYHMPYLDYAFAERMLDVSSSMLETPRRLVIAGDLFEVGVMSRFPRLNPFTPSLRAELRAAGRFIEDAQDVFDYIDVLLGNHERRIIYQLLGEIGHIEIGKLMGVQRVSFHEYSHAILKTVSGDWRLTHQRNYSRNSQSVGVKLAHKFRQHIITHHQHRVSKGFDTSGECVVIDNGCMADPSYLDYVGSVDSTAPVMQQSFVVVNNGVGNLFANSVAFSGL